MPANTNPGLKVNGSQNLCCIQILSPFSFVFFEIIQTQYKRPNNITNNLTVKLQNSNQNSSLSWVRLGGV